MIMSHEAIGHTARLALLLVPVLVCSVFAVDDPAIHYADGTVVPLIQSDSELVVEFASPGDVGKATQAAMKTVGGVFRPVPWGNSQKFAILDVADKASAAQMAASRIQGFRSVRPVYRVTADGLPILSSGNIVAKVKASLSDAERDQLFAEHGVSIVRKLELPRNAYVLTPVESDADEVAIAADLFADGRTMYSQPDFRVPLGKCAIDPNDVTDDYFEQFQWYLYNTGYEGGTEGSDISILDAWEYSTGLDVTLSFLDDACDLEHEDLGFNYIGWSHDASLTGEEGEVDEWELAANPIRIGDRHGTCMAGLACAVSNDIGIRGAAPSASFTFSRGLDDLLTNSQVASTYTFAERQSVMVHCNGWNSSMSNEAPVSDVIADTIYSVFTSSRSSFGDEGLGMVVVFATGNDSLSLIQGYDFSTLRSVIAVGASNARDQRAEYSNYCANMIGLAPSDPGNEAATLPGLLTTDNTDLSGFIEPGYNIDGQDDAGDGNFTNPNFTWSNTIANDSFGQTSAASALTAGVVALMLEINPNLTATQVRLVLEHTMDQVRPANAEYHDVTRRSEKYGYGRINAGAACKAVSELFSTSQTTNSISGETWPDRVINVKVEDNTITWDKNDDLRDEGPTSHYGDKTVSTLVVEFTNGWADWTPEDKTTYRVGVEDPASGVVVLGNEDITEFEFEDPGAGTKYFAIYAINSIKHYSWGVAVTSDGEVIDPGLPIPGESEGGDDDGGEIPDETEEPKVSITASPMTGYPDANGLFTVEFRGNAQTDSGIAETVWDFGDGSTDIRRTVEHVYSVGNGGTSFTATFTVTDNDGDVGSRSITINVLGIEGNDNSTGQGSVRIVAKDDAGEEVSTGYTPLEVLLSLDVSDLPGSVGNIFWDLGDGTTADALSVSHTFTGGGNYLVSVQVEVITGDSTTIRTASKIIAVIDSSNGNSNTNTNSNSNGNSNSSTGGSTAGTCGVGMIMPLLGLVAFSLIRRRFN